MPPKQRITREMILERSFAMFCKEGMEVVNARSVAKALNCSTQPIFSYFSGMEDLKGALNQKANELYESAIGAGGANLVDRCCAYVRFASEQPRLFSHLFLRANGAQPLYKAAGDELIRAEGGMYGLTDEQAKEIALNLSIYAHGIGAILAAGSADYDADAAHAMIEKAHDAMLAAAGK